MKSLFAVNFGRVLLVLSFLSLASAWIAKDETVFGMNQAHLFSDASVWALLGIGMLIDGIIHRKEEGKI